MTDRLYTLSSDFARKHSQSLRDYASLFVLAELESAPPPAPKEIVKTLEALAREFEAELSLLEPTTDPAPRFRAAGGM